MSTAQPLSIPRNLLFRYRFKCPKVESKPDSIAAFGGAGDLPTLGIFDGQTPFAQAKCGWSEGAFFLGIAVRGKQQSIWTRTNQPLECDGVQLWIDTRDTHNVHRATRYCHWFYAIPVIAAGKATGQGAMLKINRAKEDSPTINRGKPVVQATTVSDGYDLIVQIPANLLNGWSPADQRQIGFHFLVHDRELGENSLSIDSSMPVAEDPSLWCSLELVD